LEKLEMKKTLVALAAVSAVSAFAQSSVTIYGSIDGGIRNQTNADTLGNSVSVFQSGAIKSNRLGFEGKEDLGGGSYSSFRLESGMDVNIGTQGGFISGSNGGRTFDREAWIKLGNGNGALTIGRQYHPVFAAYCQVSTTYCMGGGYVDTTAGLDWGVNTVGKRWDSMANVNLIANSEFQANLAYSAGASPASSSNSQLQATPGNSNGGKGNGLNLIWTPASNIAAVYGHQTAYTTLNAYGTAINNSTSVVALVNSIATLGNNTSSPVQWTTDVFGGSYKTGDWTFRGNVTAIHNDASTPEKLKTTGLGAKYVSGLMEFNVSRTQSTQNSATSATADGKKLTSTILWAQYNISKTTFAYVGLDKSSWDSGFTGNPVSAPATIAFLPAANSGSTGSAGTSTTGLWAGMNKSF
jgi:predicted porin